MAAVRERVEHWEPIDQAPISERRLLAKPVMVKTPAHNPPVYKPVKRAPPAKGVGLRKVEGLQLAISQLEDGFALDTGDHRKCVPGLCYRYAERYGIEVTMRKENGTWWVYRIA